MIDIVICPPPLKVKEPCYSYRRVSKRLNPGVLIDNIEDMTEEEQTILFLRMSSENATLYVTGGDADSFLRKVFIQQHLDNEGYIRKDRLGRLLYALCGDYNIPYKLTDECAENR